MIKLERDFIPDFFTRENLDSLTQDFKDNGTPVWHDPEVKSACLKLSHGKCAFCEVKLDEASTYHEVEHFKDKTTFPDDVIKWGNLLPSCRHCNGSKQRRNVVLEPIINPCDDFPQEHLYIRGYRIKGKTKLGRDTVDALNFNHTDHKYFPRCKAGGVIESSIELVEDTFELYLESPTTRRRNKLFNIVEALLNECQRTSAFSAVSATTLHSSAEYNKIKAQLVELKLWTKYMQELHENSLAIVLTETL